MKISKRKHVDPSWGYLELEGGSIVAMPKKAMKELQAEIKQLKKEVADYHQLQWQYDALIDKNERLKKFVSKLQGKIDRQGSMLYWLERTNGFLHETIRNQSKFSRKLRCLALHGMIGYAACKMNLVAEKYKDDEKFFIDVPKEFSEWRRKKIEWTEAYRNAKKELR